LIIAVATHDEYGGFRIEDEVVAEGLLREMPARCEVSMFID
jgi:hypothetical protein